MLKQYFSLHKIILIENQFNGDFEMESFRFF